MAPILWLIWSPSNRWNLAQTTGLYGPNHGPLGLKVVPMSLLVGLCMPIGIHQGSQNSHGLTAAGFACNQMERYEDPELFGGFRTPISNTWAPKYPCRKDFEEYMDSGFSTVFGGTWRSFYNCSAFEKQQPPRDSTSRQFRNMPSTRIQNPLSKEYPLNQNTKSLE